MEPSWHVVRTGLGPMAPFSPALERAFAYERMRRSFCEVGAPCIVHISAIKGFSSEDS